MIPEIGRGCWENGYYRGVMTPKIGEARRKCHYWRSITPKKGVAPRNGRYWKTITPKIEEAWRKWSLLRSDDAQNRRGAEKTVTIEE
jgi:hypothetical protein